MLSGLLANTIYVQVRKNHFRVRHIESRRERQFSAPRPFTTRRLLVGQFQEAATLLRGAIRDFAGGLLSVSPVIVIHPVEMADGGLSEVEQRIFRELALSAGARRAIVHEGALLSDADVVAVCNGRTERGSR